MIKAQLTRLGFVCRISTGNQEQNRSKKYQIGIIINAQEYFGVWPQKSILLQLEDMNDAETSLFHPKHVEAYLTLLRKAHAILDYSPSRIKKLRELPSMPPIYLLEFDHYREIVSDVGKRSKKPVWFYGYVNQRRGHILKNLTNFTEVKDKLSTQEFNNGLDRSQIALNIHLYDSEPLNVPYISILLARGAFVISECGTDSALIERYKDIVYFTDISNLTEICSYWLDPANQSEKKSWLERSHHASIQLHSQLPMILSDLNLDYLNNEKIDDIDDDIDEEIESLYSHFSTAKTNILKNNAVALVMSKAPEDESSFPTVSIVTITRNRSHLFPMAVRNWNSFKYPRQKMEWIIIDDTPESHDYHLDLPKSDLIKYIYIPSTTPIPVAEKRNMCLEKAQNEIIVHMDDDDYYYPMSIYAKVKILLDYKKEKYECVGTDVLGVYNLMENYSHVIHTFSLPEASMAYWKTFGEQGRFAPHHSGESIPFLQGRKDRVITIPFQFNMIAITHGRNLTRNLRTSTKDEKNHIYKSLDFETQRFLNGLYRANLMQCSPNLTQKS